MVHVGMSQRSPIGANKQVAHAVVAEDVAVVPEFWTIWFDEFIVVA